MEGSFTLVVAFTSLSEDSESLSETLESASAGSTPELTINDTALLHHWASLASTSDAVSSIVAVVDRSFQCPSSLQSSSSSSPPITIIQSSSHSPSHASCLSDALEARAVPPSSGAILADGLILPEPHFDLHQLALHAHTLSRDCVLFTSQRNGVFLGQCALLSLDPATSTSSTPLIQSVRPNAAYAVGSSSSIHASSFSKKQQHLHVFGAPLMFLQPNTLEYVPRWVNDRDCDNTLGEVQHLAAALHSQQWSGKVHALRGRYIFSVSSPSKLRYTDRLFRFIAEEQNKAAARTSATSVNEGESQLPLSQKEEVRKMQEKRRRMLNRAVDLEKLLPVFELRHEQASCQDTQTQGTSSPTTSRRSPPAFADAQRFKQTKNRTKKHPCFETTSNCSHGAKEPLQEELPEEWYGLNGRFTSSFSNLMFKRNGLQTSRERSSVHSALEEL